MAGGSKASKHIPKRASNSKRKDMRQGCWVRASRARVARNKCQQEAAARNRELRKAGQLTPWEQAKAARRARRALVFEAVKVTPQPGRAS